MQRPRVYIETSIPSLYFDERSDARIAAWRRWTRERWATAHERYELLTGVPVHEERALGPADRQPAWFGLIRELPALVVTPGVREVFKGYVRHKLMPADVVGDGMHLALASYFACDFLLTWDQEHLANENKFAHIQRINDRFGLRSPRIVTPRQMLRGDDEEG